MRPSLCAPSALRGAVGGASMTTPGGAGTTLRPHVCRKATRARRTGFYHRVGASMATLLRPFVVDRNICHFLWYGGVAGDGLRSVGVSPPSKSVCSILPIAICGPGLYGAPAFLCAW